MNTEIWKDIEQYEGLYQVSNFGCVKRLPSFHCKKEHILKPHICSTGYYVVVLSKNGKTKTHKVHRLVAKAFVPNPHCLNEVSHLDESRTNNFANNLTWCTPKENNNMPLRKIRSVIAHTGKKFSEKTRERMRQAQLGERSHRYGKKNELCGASKPVIQMTQDGVFVTEFPSASEAQRQTGICSTHIGSCATGTRKTAGKFKWIYKRDNV